jgi:Zinc dependent phospholipase C
MIAPARRLQRPLPMDLAFARRALAAALALSAAATPAHAYGVLSHLALVDAAWDDALVPALRQRFSGVTAEELHRAHACAFGGALAQDMGYYPGGSRPLSDLMHYVRSGDFVRALAEEAETPAEYGFALGALAHYLGDSEGHPLGVNRVVPLTFPKLRARFGDLVTYTQKPSAHLRVEFGFDVVQVARGLYPPESYRDFIGFEVPLPLLARAVRRTYGVELTSFLPRPERAIRSFRKFVTTLFPRATRVAWAYKKDEIRKLLPTASEATFVYNLSNAAFEKQWGKDYDRPGLRSRVIAFLLRLVPKIGPLRVLIPKPPTAEGERVYEESFNVVLGDYRHAVGGQAAPQNVNLDVGAPTPPGAYDRADAAWADLCTRLARADFAGADPALVAAILAHFGGPSAPAAPPRLAPVLLRLQQRTQ